MNVFRLRIQIRFFFKLFFYFSLFLSLSIMEPEFFTFWFNIFTIDFMNFIFQGTGIKEEGDYVSLHPFVTDEHGKVSSIRE